MTDMIASMATFGENLKQLMNCDRVSVSELAKAIGEPTKTVQEWVGPKGRSPRSMEAIPKLAAFFKVSTHFLLFGEDDPHNALSSIFEKSEIHTGLYEITIKKVNSNKK